MAAGNTYIFHMSGKLYTEKQSGKPVLLWVILVLAFFLRVAVAVSAIITTRSISVFHFRDTAAYLSSAMELLRFGTFSIEKIPCIVRTPGYPVMLLPGLALGNVEIITIFLQIIASCLTVFLVFKTALRLTESLRTAHIAAFLYALEPLSILFSSTLLTETFFTFCITATVYCMVDYIKSPSLSRLLIAAIVCAGSAYIRPISCFLPYLFGISLLLPGLRRLRKEPGILLHTALFLLVSLGAIYAWQLRNHSQTGYHGFSAIQDVNLYYYGAAAVVARNEGRPYLVVQDSLGYQNELFLIDHPYQRVGDQARHFNDIRGKAETILAAHFPAYCRIHFEGMIRMLLDPGATGFLQLFKIDNQIDMLIGDALDKGFVGSLMFFIRERPWVFWGNAVLGLFLLAYYLGAAIGFVKADKSMSTITIIGVIIYLILLSGGANAVSRFRHPCMPLLCLFAGQGLQRLFKK
jgi:4-amino-4-deoxy-L-arabinose transferase-like glycosyltransferase